MKNTLRFKMILVTLITLFAASLFAGLSVANFADATEPESVSVFKMVNGAEVRVKDPSGLRFIVQMSDDYYTELTTESTSKLYVAVVPYSYYERYKSANYAGVLCEYLTANEKQFISSEIPVDKIYSKVDNEQTYYYANAVISNLLFNNYNGSFVGVGYIARTVGNTTTYEEVAALDKNANARSVFSVAFRAPGGYAPATQQTLDTIIEKALYNAAGVTYDSTSEKYIYNETEYEDYTSVGITPSLESMTLETTSSVRILKGDTETVAKTFTFSGGTAFGGDAMYVWSSSDESVATVSDSGVITAVDDGSCTITLSALDGKYTSDCAVEVYSYENLNYAASRYFGQWNSTGITMEYDDDDQAIELTKLGAGISGSHSHIEISVMDEVRAAKAAGMKMLSFEYYADGINADGTSDTTIRIVANNNGADIGQNNSIFTDFLLTKEMEGRWNKVIIDLDPANPNYDANIDNTLYKNFEIGIGGSVGGTFKIRNVKFGDATDYNTAFVTNYYDNVNYTEYQHLGEWQAADGAGAYIDYITQWGVTRIVKQGTGFSGSYDHVVIEIMDEVRAAKAAGKKLLTFEYMTFGGLYGEGSHSPKMYIGSSNGAAGTAGVSYWLTQQEHITSTEAKYYKIYIDLGNDLVDYTGFKYLSILVGGEYDGYLCIRNLKFEGAAEYDAIKYDITDYSDWNRWLSGRGASTWTDDCGMSYDYDDVNDAVIFTKGANTDAFHYGSTYLEIMDEVRAAIAAGKTKLSFEYYTANAGSSQGTRLWIAGVTTASKDMVTGSGIWITIGETLTLNAWTKVEIDLTSSNPCLTNITNENNEYLGIIFDGAQGATLKIREFKFS